jgi:hypothetical protein
LAAELDRGGFCIRLQLGVNALVLSVVENEIVVLKGFETLG